MIPIAFKKAKITNVQPAPCQIPTINNEINDAVIVCINVRVFKNLTIGIYTQAVIAFVNEMCHLCQKFIILDARYGELKLIGISRFIILDKPTAISLYPLKSK